MNIFHFIITICEVVFWLFSFFSIFGILVRPIHRLFEKFYSQLNISDNLEKWAKRGAK